MCRAEGLVIMIIGGPDRLTGGMFVLNRKGDPHYVPFISARSLSAMLL